MLNYILDQMRGASVFSVPVLISIWLFTIITERKRLPNRAEFPGDVKEFVLMNIATGVVFLGEGIVLLTLLLLL